MIGIFVEKDVFERVGSLCAIAHLSLKQLTCSESHGALIAPSNFFDLQEALLSSNFGFRIMAEEKGRARIILKSIFSEIERIATVVSEFGQRNDLSDEVIYDIRLVLEEIVSNIIKYGYKDNDEHKIDIYINLETNILTLEIKDDGNPFNPLEFRNAIVERPLDEREAGGMGIYIVKNLMDKSEYRRVGNNNILLLKKYITR